MGQAEVGARASAMKLRLHQFLSKTGHFTSKREVKEAVWSGDITVNDSVVKDIAFQFNARKKEVAYRGTPLRLPSEERTFLLNKPRGVVCSRLNSQEAALGKRSVFEVFRPHLAPMEPTALTVKMGPMEPTALTVKMEPPSSSRSSTQPHV